jgi:hypothetical protein
MGDPIVEAGLLVSYFILILFHFSKREDPFFSHASASGRTPTLSAIFLNYSDRLWMDVRRGGR